MSGVATEIVTPLVQESDPELFLTAYYYSFEPTGVAIIDEILSQVAVAGKGSHSTETWGEDHEYEYRGSTASYVERIQQAADQAATAISNAVRDVKERGL